MNFKMLIFTAVVLLLFANFAYSQNNGGFTDNFGDGNFTDNPVWIGDENKFVINESNQLQLNDTITGAACLATNSAAINDAEWEFYIKYDFNPTTSNYCDVYLVSNNSDLNSCTEGYYVRVCGASTIDNICLYKKSGSTRTLLTSGPEHTFTESNNEMKIKVSRTSEGVWSMYSDLGVTGVYTMEGESITDNSFTTSEYFGFYCKYSKTRANAFFFDDVNVSGSYFVDTEAPILLSSHFASNNSIILNFNENLDANSIDAANFDVDNEIGRPTTAELYNETSHQVILQFENTFSNGVTYTLSYRGISDINANTISNSTTQLTFSESGSGSVVINEIMADPSPIVGLPDAEYVEIYNNSPEPVDLENWTLKINSTVKILDAYTLLPNEYLILCRPENAEPLQDYGNVLAIEGLSQTALVNSGAEVILYNQYMSEIDKIKYSSSWYKDSEKKDGGWSLERIDPNNKCEQTTNWAASVNENGGTPGQINSLYADNTDNTAPSVVNITISSGNELRILFSESLDSSSVKILSNFNLDNSYGNPIYSALSIEDSKILILMFGNSFAENLTYNFYISGVSDLCGNIMEPQTISFSTIPVKFNSIIVSEIMADPSPVVELPEVKYIEIYNRTENPISLSEWMLQIGNTLKTFPPVIINPSSYLVLCNTDKQYLFEEDANTVGIEGFPSFAQDGATITLFDKAGNVIHTLTFSSSWHDDSFKANGGYSLEIVDLNNTCQGEGNWRSTLDVTGGTPGRENSVNGSNPDFSAPYPTAAEIVNDTLWVYFNEILLPEFAQNASNYMVEELGNPTTIELIKPQMKVLKMTFIQPFEIGRVYYLKINDTIVDCNGNSVEANSQIRFGIGVNAEFNDLVINEILFNPYLGGSDFIEFYNKSNKIIDLKDLWIANTDEFNKVKDSYQITNISRLILPEEYCAISVDIENLYNFYNVTYPENLYKVANMPGYSDDFGTVILVNRYFDTIDVVSYDKSQHYKLLSSKDGVSLERINYNVESSEKSNWHSAAQDAGFATPGYINSQYAAEIVAESAITLSSEVFSPDNDGYEDQLNIHYSLDMPGYSGSFMIYSSNGRLVKYLANNQTFGIEGNLFWDGFDEENKICPIGIYILYVELFNLEGKKIVEKHSVVLSVKVN